jgi:polyvinyl alcohol dehydrogenase (cytochrome)
LHSLGLGVTTGQGRKTVTKTSTLRNAPVAAALGLFSLALASLAAPHAALAQFNQGEVAYNSTCATCHDNPEASHAPSKATLTAMTPQALDYTLTQGKMRAMAKGLSDAQRGQLITYLTGQAGPSIADDWTKAMMCPAGHASIDLKQPALVTTFGYDKANTRTLTAKQAGLTKAQLSDMEVAWAIAFPGEIQMRAQPAIVGKTIFLPVADAAAMYAIDISNPGKPCIQWVYKTANGAPLRSSPSYGVLADGRGVLAFGGQDTTIHLVDAKTGKAIWAKKVGAYAWSMATGTPIVLKDRIIVPIAQFEISVGAANNQICCNNHGYILSLNPKYGAQQWRYDTMEEAKPIKDRGDGKMVFGPSGAPIWNSPSVDEKRGLIYFGTGESNSPPVSVNTDAMIAIGLADGKQKWSRQATTKDIYTIGCGANPRPDQLNCFGDTVFRDADFGASFILGHLKRGVDVVYAGQKAGTVFAVQPETGELLWRTPLGTGGALGGVHWGIAFHDDTVFAPVSATGRDLPGEPVDPNRIKSGMYALDANTGAIKWQFVSAPDCAGDRIKRMPACQRAFGFSAAPAVIDGTVIEGALDGYLYVLDEATGKQIWKFDTTLPIQTLNGVPGKGGAIDAASITAGDGMLFVNSGYGQFGQQAGNLFIAFKPKAR